MPLPQQQHHSVCFTSNGQRVMVLSSPPPSSGDDVEVLEVVPPTFASRRAVLKLPGGGWSGNEQLLTTPAASGPKFIKTTPTASQDDQGDESRDGGDVSVLSLSHGGAIERALHRIGFKHTSALHCANNYVAPFDE